MSISIDSAIAALAALATAMGPRAPYVGSGPRANVDLGTVSPEDYARIEKTMHIAWTVDNVDEQSQSTCLTTYGSIGSVSVTVRTLRPATPAELRARLAVLESAIESAALADLERAQ